MNAPTLNLPTPLEVINALHAVADVLKAIDLDSAHPSTLVPLVNATKDVAAFVAAIDAQIQLRAVTNGELLPGVRVEETKTNRAWCDEAAAAELARGQFGDDAFTPPKLKSPAQLEKLGPAGKAFAAVCSEKPPGAKKAVY